MALGQAELGRDEHFVAMTLHRFAEAVLGAGLGVVGGGVEVVDAALDRLAGDVDGLAPPGARARTEGDVGDHRAGPAEPAVSFHPRTRPLVPGDVGLVRRSHGEDVGHGDRAPASVGPDRGGEARRDTREGAGGGAEEAAPTVRDRGVSRVLRYAGVCGGAERQDDAGRDGEHDERGDGEVGGRREASLDPVSEELAEEAH